LSAIKTDSDDEKAGVELIKQFWKSATYVAINSGKMPVGGWSSQSQNQDNWGFNALTNQFEDLIKAGVIEPAKSGDCLFENAASVASMILTTECLVADAPRKMNLRCQLVWVGVCRG
jgi:chaperonin GroEL